MLHSSDFNLEKNVFNSDRFACTIAMQEKVSRRDCLMDDKSLSILELTSARPQLTALAWQSSLPTAWCPQARSCYELEMWKDQQTPVLEG